MKIETDKNSTVFLDLSKQVVGDMRTRVEESGRTHAALADILHVDRSAISKTLNENTNLTLRKIAEIAAATGSRCYFRMTRNSNLEKGSDAIAMMATSSQSDPAQTDKGFNQTGLRKRAAAYVKQLLREGTFLDADDYYVGLPDDQEAVDGWLEGDVERDGDAFILISPKDEKHQASVADLAITFDFAFSDGFAEVEWSLIDRYGSEYFRSRDLRQVAQLALIVLSRGGFKN